MTLPDKDARDARGVWWAANAWHDVRYGARLILRTPTLSVAALLIVAIGIGATTAMFSIVYGVLLRPMPYGDAERLVNIWSTAPSRGLPRAYVGMANVYDWKSRNRVFDDIASARAIANFKLAGEGTERERLLGARISANLLTVLRVSPGVYGLISYSVGQRYREFGVRVALGAGRAEIVRLVMGRGALLFAAGAAIGLAAAAASARIINSLLYNIGGFDLASFVAATTLLLMVAMTACGVPARRAAQVDPAATLRAA